MMKFKTVVLCLKLLTYLIVQRSFNYNKKTINPFLIYLQLRMLATITFAYWINVTNLRLLLINPLKIQEVVTTSEVVNGEATSAW